MRAVLANLQRELRAYFFSPLAYIVAAILIVVAVIAVFLILRVVSALIVSGPPVVTFSDCGTPSRSSFAADRKAFRKLVLSYW